MLSCSELVGRGIDILFSNSHGCLVTKTIYDDQEAAVSIGRNGKLFEPGVTDKLDEMESYGCYECEPQKYEYYETQHFQVGAVDANTVDSGADYEGDGVEFQQVDPIDPIGEQQALEPVMAKPVNSPVAPTPAETRQHELTLLPFKPWCCHCVR